jgi:hypothetical protein
VISSNYIQTKYKNIIMENQEKVCSLKYEMHCPNCGAEIVVVYHQCEIDLGGGHIWYDIPDINDPVYCTRCGTRI